LKRHNNDNINPILLQQKSYNSTYLQITSTITQTIITIILMFETIIITFQILQ